MTMNAPILLSAALALTCALPVPLAAEVDPPLVRIDLVEGWQTPDGAQMAGVRIRVAEGWKTYWRSPGDAGIPPQFDWSGSDNLRAVRMHWPRPVVFDQFGSRSIGYSGEIVFPVELFPRDTALPVTVAGRADLGVCKDVCVPVSATFSGATTDGADRIRAALADVPNPRGIDTATCDIAPIADGVRVTATLGLGTLGGAEVAVFELMNSDVWISEPVTERTGTRITATADIVPPEAAPFALDRSDLRITVLGRDGAVETLGCPAG